MAQITPSELDTFPLSDLPARYNLHSRDAIHNRIKYLRQYTPIHTELRDGKKFINAQDLRLLDAIDEFIRSTPNAALKDFPIQDYITTRQSDIVVSSDNVALSDEQSELSRLVDAINAVAVAQFNPLRWLEDLEKAADKGWLLPTINVQQLIGVKPKGQVFCRGSFKFVRSGKIGGQSAWRIEKRSSTVED